MDTFEFVQLNSAPDGELIIGMVRTDVLVHVITSLICVATGIAFTVTIALPAKVPTHPFASVTPVGVYVVVVLGLTVIDFEDEEIKVTLVAVDPTVYVKLNGCVPVKSNFKSVELPLQMAFVPVNETEGNELTERTAKFDGKGQVLKTSFAINRYCFPFNPDTSEMVRVPVVVPE